MRQRARRARRWRADHHVSARGPLAPEAGQYTTKTDAAYSALRSAILSGVLLPGAPVLARKVAEELNMSLIPVREALRRLEQEGLVVIRPHVGARVRELPAKDLEEILLIRGELEVLATRLSAPVMDDATLDELDALVRRMDDCVEADNPDGYGQLNREFHMTLYAHNNNDRLLQLIQGLWDQVPRARSVFALNPDHMSSSQEGHHRLLEALRARDADAAAEVVRAQKEAARLALRRASDRLESAAIDAVE